ncbi:hypothetical protein CM15mP35_02180 [bacterium]|nr:MAG: hypothetical protein CM15mP35_02180 [bacterium]
MASTSKELKQLKEWKDIEDELNNLPDVKNKNNFQDYAISIMGQTLYELFIEGYTINNGEKNQINSLLNLLQKELI